jgi:hypothetical protein
MYNYKIEPIVFKGSYVKQQLLKKPGGLILYEFLVHKHFSMQFTQHK